jgi:hypothetical protein
MCFHRHHGVGRWLAQSAALRLSALYERWSCPPTNATLHPETCNSSPAALIAAPSVLRVIGSLDFSRVCERVAQSWFATLRPFAGSRVYKPRSSRTTPRYLALRQPAGRWNPKGKSPPRSLPAQAGRGSILGPLDSRFRGNDLSGGSGNGLAGCGKTCSGDFTSPCWR